VSDVELLLESGEFGVALLGGGEVLERFEELGEVGVDGVVGEGGDGVGVGGVARSLLEGLSLLRLGKERLLGFG
jgi:hypothetical protein